MILILCYPGDVLNRLISEILAPSQAHPKLLFRALQGAFQQLWGLDSKETVCDYSLGSLPSLAFARQPPSSSSSAGGDRPSHGSALSLPLGGVGAVGGVGGAVPSAAEPSPGPGPGGRPAVPARLPGVQGGAGRAVAGQVPRGRGPQGRRGIRRRLRPGPGRRQSPGPGRRQPSRPARPLIHSSRPLCCHFQIFIILSLCDTGCYFAPRSSAMVIGSLCCIYLYDLLIVRNLEILILSIPLTINSHYDSCSCHHINQTLSIIGIAQLNSCNCPIRGRMAVVSEKFLKCGAVISNLCPLFCKIYRLPETSKC